ncbi:unnamed protein product, partial [Durusdinium trenchii]
TLQTHPCVGHMVEPGHSSRAFAVGYIAVLMAVDHLQDSSEDWKRSGCALMILSKSNASKEASKAKQEKQSTSHEVLLQDPARRPMACPRRSCPARTSAIIISCPDEAAYRAPHLRRGLWCIQNAMNRNLRNTGDLILLEELFPNAPGSTRHEEGGGLLRQVARSSEALFNRNRLLQRSQEVYR